MSDNPRYLLDANVFIEAARRYYAFDLLPQFWSTLIEHARKERVLSIDKVQKEIERGKDELAQWAKGPFSFAFASTDRSDVVREFQQLMAWVNGQGQFFDFAKEEFANVADGWLVAFAKVEGLTLVTHEQLEPQSRKRVPIPNICAVAGVHWVDTFQMLRDLHISFA